MTIVVQPDHVVVRGLTRRGTILRKLLSWREIEDAKTNVVALAVEEVIRELSNG